MWCGCEWKNRLETMDGNEFSAYSTVFCLFFLYLKLQTIKLKLLEQNGKYFYQPDEGKVFFFCIVTFSPKGRISCRQPCPGCPGKILWMIWLVIWRLLCVSWRTWSSLVSSEWEIRLFQVCKITLQNFRQFEKPQPFKNTIKQHEGLIIEGLMI